MDFLLFDNKGDKMTETGLTASHVKKMNRKAIYHYIYERRSVAKQEISVNLRMSLTTVTQNLKALEAAGLIRKDGFYQSTGGRKAYVIRINETARVALGVSMFSKKVHITGIDLYGNLICRKVLELPYENSAEYCQTLGEAICQFAKKLPVPSESILGVGIATQGIVSRDGTSVIYGKIMDNLDFQFSRLASLIPYPCRLEHDAKAAGFAELWNKEDMEDTLVVLLNQNLGSALILGGQIHSGLHMHSGTIEHMCIMPNGPMCYCGQHGCLETYCSVESLEQAAGCSADQFFSELRAGSPARQTIWFTYLNQLALALSNINAIIDCNIIISGYLASFFTEEDLELLFHMMKSFSAFPMKENFITKREDGKFATAIGAGLYYIHHFIEQI